MKVWLYECGSFEESSKGVASTRDLAVLAASRTISAQEFSSFTQSMNTKAERDRADVVWAARGEAPYALLDFWYGDHQVEDTDENGYAAHLVWGDGENFVDVTCIDVITTFKEATA